MLSYLDIACVVTLMGLGVLRLVRLKPSGDVAILLAPTLGMSVWILAIGIAVSLGVTIQQLTTPLWLASGALAIFGATLIRTTGGAAVLAWLLALLLPMLFFAIDFAEGIANFVGSAAGDGWSYAAYGQYLWTVRRGTPGPLPPLLQYATHLSDTRFISSALLGFFSPVTGMAGDTQGAVGVFLAVTIFLWGTACAATARMLGLSGGWRLVIVATAVFSPWILVAVRVHNYDNLLALPLLPVAVVLLDDLRDRAIATGICCALVVSAGVYGYVELATVIVAGVGITLLRASVITGKREFAAVILTFAIVVGLLLVPGWHDLTTFITAQVGAALGAAARPGEGAFPELLEPSNWPHVLWGLAAPTQSMRPFTGAALRAAGIVITVLAAGGFVVIAVRKHWHLTVLELALLAAAVVMLWRGHYAYAGYKFLLIGWWIVVLALVAAAHDLLTRLPHRRWLHAGAVAALVVVFACLVGTTALRNVRYRRGLMPSNLAVYRQLFDLDRVVGRAPIVVDIDDPGANVWAVYFLRQMPIRLIQYRGYMAFPHVGPVMDQSVPVPVSSASYVLTDWPTGRPSIWSAGPYILSRVPETGMALLGEIDNPNGIERNRGRFLWLGKGETHLSILSTRNGTAILSADLQRGPVLSDQPERHLAVRVNDGTERRITIQADGHAAIDIPVMAGMNNLRLLILDRPPATTPEDSKTLLLGMQSPEITLNP